MRPRRTEINPKIKYWNWANNKGMDLARFDFGVLTDMDETKKESTFKANPGKAKRHNHIFSFRNRTEETDYSELENFTQNLITATP